MLVVSVEVEWLSAIEVVGGEERINLCDGWLVVSGGSGDELLSVDE